MIVKKILFASLLITLCLKSESLKIPSKVYFTQPKSEITVTAPDIPPSPSMIFVKNENIAVAGEAVMVNNYCFCKPSVEGILCAKKLINAFGSSLSNLVKPMVIDFAVEGFSREKSMFILDFNYGVFPFKECGKNIENVLVGSSSFLYNYNITNLFT